MGVENETVVNKWSTADVKACLDEYTIEFFKKEKKLQQDFTFSNITLVLGYLGCILAVYAHFTPIPFPENIYIIIGFVVIYGSISGFLQFSESFIIKDRIFKSKSKSGATYAIRTNLPLFSSKYNVTLVQTQNGSKTEKKMEECISKWFDEEGKFVESSYNQSLRKVFK